MPTLVCPIDRGSLAPEGAELCCQRCHTRFPVVNGVPILINDENSVFRRDDYTQSAGYVGASGYGGSVDRTSGLRRAYRRFAQRLSEAPVPGAPFDALDRILDEKPAARILVIGSGEREMRGNVTYTDVALAKNIVAVCDGHDLPFEDGSFDAVFAEAVLEHVCDPARVVSEITRVLAPDGMVYAVTPFLQPVHMSAYDFTRFTYLGHRRLFRQFDDLGSGMCGGPAYSAIHLMRTTMLGVTDRHRLQNVMRLAALLITYPMRHLDRLLSRTNTSYNAACATYFLGRKRATVISDRDMLSMFRGN
jgi:SAM-dependent methyltransferase